VKAVQWETKWKCTTEITRRNLKPVEQSSYCSHDGSLQ